MKAQDAMEKREDERAKHEGAAAKLDHQDEGNDAPMKVGSR